MARTGGRGSGTAGYHSDRSADLWTAATRVPAFLVAGRPFQHQPDVRRWIEQRSQPAEGARKAFASQSPQWVAALAGRRLQSRWTDLLLHAYEHQPELRCHGAEGAPGLGDRQAVEVGPGRGGRFHLRWSYTRVPGAGRPEQADLLWAQYRAGGGRAGE